VKGASITQWISVCACDLIVQGSNEVLERTARCAVCSKPVVERKSGSLTQWIFDKDGCQCERPQPQWESEGDSYKGAAFQGFDGDQSEVELNVDAGKFPLERYKPLKKLGSGVSGTVYLSRDRLLKKKVAVKVLRTPDREALISFQKEARTTSKFTHPNIVKLLDFGITEGGVPFMVMEYVPGTSLENYIKDHGPLSPFDAISVFVKLADALDYAHNANVLHRDLKPSNILLVTEDGTVDVQLIDFGVAKIQEELSTTIVNGTALVGTPAYMSPDQALGHSFDRRSDIYSLGCILFESVTGKQPFFAESPLETISLHAHEPAPSLLSFVDENPTTIALDKVVETCMAKDPRLRYQNGTAFRRALLAVPLEEAQHPLEYTGKDDPVSKDVQPGIKIAPLGFATAAIALAIAIFTVGFYLFKAFNEDRSVVSSRIRIRSTHLEPLFGDADKEVMPLNRFIVSKTNDGFTARAVEASDSDLKAFLKLRKPFNRLNLEGSPITEKGFGLLEFSQVKELTLFRRSLSQAEFRAIASIDALESLAIDCEDNIKLAALTELRKARNLKTLEIRGVKLTDKLLTDISEIRTLTTLALSLSNNCDNVDFSVLTKLPHLGALIMQHSDATDKAVGSLSSLKSLVKLDLSGSRVTDKCLPDLAKMKLQLLELQSCSAVSEEAEADFRRQNPSTVLLHSARPPTSQLNEGRGSVYRKLPKIKLGSNESVTFTEMDVKGNVLKNYKSLQKLVLDRCSVDAGTMHCIENFKNLEDLKFIQCKGHFIGYQRLPPHAMPKLRALTIDTSPGLEGADIETFLELNRNCKLITRAVQTNVRAAPEFLDSTSAQMREMNFLLEEKEKLMDRKGKNFLK
jgi:serine/threonine protein kinase